MAALLVIARGEGQSKPASSDDLNNYELYVIIKEQIKLLKEDMDRQGTSLVEPFLLQESLERVIVQSAAEEESKQLERLGKMSLCGDLTERYNAAADGGLEPTLSVNKGQVLNSASWEFR